MIPTLPGSIPGLLRRGSPVIDAKGELGTGIVRWLHVGGVVDVCWDDSGSVEPVAPFRADLDLTDASGRAHAAWWLGAALNVGAATLVTFTASSIGGRRWLLVGRRFHNDHTGWTGFDVQSRSAHDSYLYHLDDLDPDDPRIFPDGSRLVDALALSIIVRHLAGLDPA